MLNSLRIKFIRGEEVKYISHLDLMKAFERALRRSDLPIAYSQGFNPHPQMVFGLPLAVGVASEAEYADFDFSEPVDTAEFIERLNRQMPMGLKIIDARPKLSRSNIMASVSAAIYEIDVISQDKNGKDDIRDAMESLLREDAVYVLKEGKKAAKSIDIRPMIHTLELADRENEGTADTIRAQLSAGSKANLKPELLVSAIAEKLGKDLKISGILRKELFVEHKGKLASPLTEEVLQ